jgi:hypothetical protein
LRSILVISDFVRLFLPMQISPAPIRDHIKELLSGDSGAFERWGTLVTNAAANAEWLGRQANQRPGISFFAKMGDVAAATAVWSISVRRRGFELGILELRPPHPPNFTLQQPKKEKSVLTRVFTPLAENLRDDHWNELQNGCEWASAPAREFFKLLATCKPTRRPRELALEEALVAGLRKRRFWFRNCSLVQWEKGQSFPFKFTSPIIVRQGGVGAQIPKLHELVLAADSYGATDILVRAQAALGGGRKRVAVLELKKPRGNASVSLLQAYSYAVALDEAQRLENPKTPDFQQSLRQLLGHSKPTPKRIRFAAYAVVDDKEVAKVRNSKLTEMVLQEAGDNMLVGILGYKLDVGGIRLTQAKQWVDGKWTDFMLAAPADRRIVSLD